MKAAHRLFSAAAGFGLLFIATGIAAGTCARRWWEVAKDART